MIIEREEIKTMEEKEVAKILEETPYFKKAIKEAKEQGRKEAIDKIKDKWIAYINNIPYDKTNFQPLLSIGHIRDDFLAILDKEKK